jgi:predicted ATPase
MDSISFIEPIHQELRSDQFHLESNHYLQARERIQKWKDFFHNQSPQQTMFEDEIRNMLIGNSDQNLWPSMELGLSNSTKILLELLLLGRDNIVFISHPDVFLDVNHQLQLADLLAEYAIRDEKKIIIETHSQYLLLRVKKRLRQKNNWHLPKEFVLFHENLNHEKIGVLFCKKEQDGSSKCQTIPLDQEGEFTRHWPGGFFEESIRERFDS